MKDLDFFTQIPEEDLIDAARSDADAFGILYERYVDRIYNYVYFRVGNVQDAEDITAKVFFKAFAYKANTAVFTVCIIDRFIKNTFFIFSGYNSFIILVLFIIQTIINGDLINFHINMTK